MDGLLFGVDIHRPGSREGVCSRLNAVDDLQGQGSSQMDDAGLEDDGNDQSTQIMFLASIGLK